MSDHEEDNAGVVRSSRTPSYGTTISYDAAGSMTPIYYPNDHDYANVDRPWMSTGNDLFNFQRINRLVAMICGPRALWTGWNRVRINPFQARRCTCCGQKIRNRRKGVGVSYVLTDEEYMRVDNVLSRVFAEMNEAVEGNTERHLGNIYRILTDNEAVLRNGLRELLFTRVQNVVRTIHSLFRETVPESDVQMR